MLELPRYVVLNPVRAGMVADEGEWSWSSYGAMTGKAPSPPWLQTDWILGQFGEYRAKAEERYKTEFTDPKAAMVAALGSGDYMMKQIAEAFVVHYSTVSLAVGRSEYIHDFKTPILERHGHSELAYCINVARRKPDCDHPRLF